MKRQSLSNIKIGKFGVFYISNLPKYSSSQPNEEIKGILCSLTTTEEDLINCIEKRYAKLEIFLKLSPSNLNYLITKIKFLIKVK